MFSKIEKIILLSFNIASLLIIVLGVATYKDFEFAKYFYFSLTGLESDLIHLYSISKDIYSGISIKTFGFGAAPGFFTERFFSLLFFPLIDSPVKHFFFFPIFRMLFIIAILSYFLKKTFSQNFTENVNTLIVAMIIFSLYGLITSTENFFFLVRQYYLSATHGIAFFYSIVAFFIFYENKLNSKIYYFAFCFFIFLITISFFLFAIYFGSFVFINWLFNKDKETFIRSLKIFFICFLSIVISFIFNRDNTVQVVVHYEPLFKNFLSLEFHKIIKAYILTMFPILILYIFLRFKKNNNQLIDILFYGNLLYTTILFLTFLIKQPFDLRYVCGNFLITVILLSVILKKYLKLKITKSFQLILFVIITWFGYEKFINNKFGILNRFSEEVKCVNNINEPHTIVSTYWPAKIVFEFSNRKHNLYQVTPVLRFYDWSFNHSWLSINKDAQGMLILLNGMKKKEAISLIKDLEKKGGKLKCGGRILQINKKIFN